MLKRRNPRNDKTSGAMPQDKTVMKDAVKTVRETQDTWANL